MRHAQIVLLRERHQLLVCAEVSPNALPSKPAKIDWIVEGAGASGYNSMQRIEPFADDEGRGNGAVWRCGSLLPSLTGENPRTLYGLNE